MMASGQGVRAPAIAAKEPVERHPLEPAAKSAAKSAGRRRRSEACPSGGAVRRGGIGGDRTSCVGVGLGGALGVRGRTTPDSHKSGTL